MNPARSEALPSVTWGGIARGWLLDDRRFAVLRVVVPPALAAAAVIAPLPTAVGLLLVAMCLALWWNPNAVVLLLVALMGNAKIHYYTGALTIFPEYPLLVLAGLLWLLRAMEGSERPVDATLTWVFVWLVFAGLVSFVNALVVPRVFSKASVVLLTMLTFLLTLRGVQSMRELGRALLWLEWASLVVAGYAVLQIAGALVGLDTSLSWFEKHGNPEFFYGIGPPVIHEFTKIFRANSFFSDSNILGGYVAAVTPVVLALRLHHGSTGRRLRTTLETVLLMTLALALLFTLSRSGVLAFVCGITVVLALMRHRVGWPWFWVGALLVAVGTAGLSSVLGFNPVVMFARLGASLDLGDYSNRTHYSVAEFGVRMFLQHPLTGVGLRNFGYYYAQILDPYYPNMIAHNAFLSYFAETGVLGGVAFVTLIVLILRRSWRVVRDPELRATAPLLFTWNAGLFGALVALSVSNLFYDFYLRTFTWVLSGLAVAAAGLWTGRTPDHESRDDRTP